MLGGILSALDRDDLIQILRCMAYGMYQNPPLDDKEIRFLEQIVQLFNIDDYEKEQIFLIDIRYELDFDVVTKELYHNSAKGLFFMLEVVSEVFQDKKLNAFSKEKIAPFLPFSNQIKSDITKLASKYIKIASTIYNFIWGIEKTGLIWKTVEGEIDPYKKLFFIDHDKLNQLAIDEKKSFLTILTYLMLDDGEIDNSEKDILIQLSFFMGVEEDIVSNYESCQEISLDELESISTEWLKRLLIFSFLFSRTGELKESISKRLNIILGLGISQDALDILLKDMDVFKKNYEEIVRTIQSAAISGPDEEKGAEYAQKGLSLLGAAVSFIPVVGPALTLAQKVRQTGGIIMDRRSEGLMDFGLTDIQKDYQNKTLVVCIDGFMSELAEEQFLDWKDSFEQLKLKAWIKGFKWPSSALGTLLKSGGGAWYEAVSNTARAGASLANDIDVIYGFRPDVKIILIGHSLGARVIFNTLTRLHAMGLSVYETYFLGGAVTRTDKAQWLTALSAVEHRAYNFYSDNDDILKKLYQGTMLGDSPAGLGLIECYKTKQFTPAELFNINTTNVIGGHTEYKDKLAKLLTVEEYDFGLLAE